MKLNRLMEIAADAYPDQFLYEYWDETNERPKESSGDGLAEFIVNEISSTYDSDMSSEEQVDEAERVIRAAIDQLSDIETVLQDTRIALGMGKKGESDESS